MKELKDLDRGDVTRQALVDAAIAVFARDGYHAASTRELANVANVNQALINYHFKGKQGLYLAAFQYITDQIHSKTKPVEQKIQECLSQNDWQKMSAQKRKKILFPLLLEVADEFLKLLTSERTNEWARLIVREQQQPSVAFEFIYTAFLAPVLSIFIEIIKILRNADEEDSTIIAFSILGQLLIWRIGRTGILRRLNWTVIGENELEKLRRVVHRNIAALIFA